MIVTTDKLSVELIEAVDDCWRCGKPLTLPCVMWQGTTQIWLHRECALALADALICDGMKLGGKRETETNPDWQSKVNP